MGICTDKSTTYLKHLGYNVVQHPREGIAPLDLIGVQNRGSTYIGKLSHLVDDAPDHYPQIQRDLEAADINGRRSSSLNAGLGLSLLKGVLAAFGGNFGIDGSYKGAKAIAFEYANVLRDVVATAEIGRFLRDATIDSANPVLNQYVLGNGELFIVVETAKSATVTVEANGQGGAALKLDAAAIAQAVGTSIAVAADRASPSKLTYRGNKNLVFGFKCLHLGFVDGVLAPVNVRAGSVAMATDDEDEVPEHRILNSFGLLELANLP